MKYLIAAMLLAIGTSSVAVAQDAGDMPSAVVVPPIVGDEIPLGTVAPDTSDTEQWNRVLGQVWVRNVSRPSLFRIKPKAGRDNGRAVIIVPGGGYSFVSIESEGFWVAERLAAAGYTAFVLKYRPRLTPEAPEAFMRQLMAEWAGYSEQPALDHPPAVEDLAMAISHVRERGEEWGLDGNRIGVIGFSAGSHSAIRLLEEYDEARALHNLALIYPPSSADMVPKVHPDMFMAIATDDFLFHRETLNWVWNWHEAGGSVDFHLYAGGSHGFGMRPQGTTSDLWIEQYLLWLETRP